jgi:hypothetical protein
LHGVVRHDQVRRLESKVNEGGQCDLPVRKVGSLPLGHLHHAGFDIDAEQPDAAPLFLSATRRISSPVEQPIS